MRRGRAAMEPLRCGFRRSRLLVAVARAAAGRERAAGEADQDLNLQLLLGSRVYYIAHVLDLLVLESRAYRLPVVNSLLRHIVSLPAASCGGSLPAGLRFDGHNRHYGRDVILLIDGCARATAMVQRVPVLFLSFSGLSASPRRVGRLIADGCPHASRSSVEQAHIAE